MCSLHFLAQLDHPFLQNMYFASKDTCKKNLSVAATIGELVSSMHDKQSPEAVFEFGHVRTFKYTIRLPCTIMQASQTDLCMAGGHV
jgi:hypothetical protein